MQDYQSLLLIDKNTEYILNKYIPEGNKINDLSKLFYVFSDSTRIKILSALSITEMCVTDLSRVLYLNQTTLSHQLRVLRDYGIVKTKRQGKIIFYRVADKVVSNMLTSGIEFLGY